MQQIVGTEEGIAKLCIAEALGSSKQRLAALATSLKRQSGERIKVCSKQQSGQNDSRYVSIK